MQIKRTAVSKVTVEGLKEHGFSAVALPEPGREITGVYIGDLLSWVMGRAKSGDAWITIMSNINVLAVAALADTACVIAADDVEITEDFAKAAVEKVINILSFSGSAYDAAVLLNGLL